MVEYKFTEFRVYEDMRSYSLNSEHYNTKIAVYWKLNS